MDLKNSILNNLNYIKRLRQELHNNAELSTKEYDTQRIIMDELNKLNIPCRSMFNTGVVGLLNEGESCIGIRADMDAILVNDKPFHGCGHDYHTAMLIGVAIILKELNIDKCIKLIFQPAEEATGGALPMIKEGVLSNPKVKYIMGYHVWPSLQVGKLEIPKGPSMASIDDFKIYFKGKGGHAALPHLCINPLYPAMEFVNTMTLKSRIESNPLNLHVLTFTSINGSKATNVIPEEIEVLGTLRTFDNDFINKMKQDLESIAELTAKKYNCDYRVNFETSFPPLINDESLCKKFNASCINLLGEESILPLEPTFASEDFSFFAKEVPSVHFRIGIMEGEKGIYPLHSPSFSASDEALFYGIYSVVNFIING
ncbi:M20 family metallopeptidase [Clostridium malenominatum]|uniref:M20 family metallopeptidase n=1 Tax=Clostridium malenominatum TaxID=1539 RepID=A0ABP3TZG5_9CLOT